MQTNLVKLALALAILGPATASAEEAGRDNPPAAATMKIVAGLLHTCAMTGAGVLKCWGLNAYGMLGDGTTDNRSRPVFPKGLHTGVADVDTGGIHTCAVKAGILKCWGDNSVGQLGDGTLQERDTPTNVKGLTGNVTAVAAGFEFTCAIASGVKCWGDNNSGQLGDNTTTTRSLPAPVIGLKKTVTGVAAGGGHACALTATGGVECWGANGSGQLGDGTINARHTPVAVTGLTKGIVALALGNEFSCALSKTGGVKCWGYGGDGALGDNNPNDKRVPTGVQGLASGVTAIAAGYSHMCALTKAGGVKCWGANTRGQIGDGTTKVRLVPVDVMGLQRGIAAIGAGGRTFGDEHSCALTKKGDARCWGFNLDGQLGNGTTTNSLVPVKVKGF